LSIASRMRKKQETGDSPFFPRIESGWELWGRQIEWCRSRGVPHLLVDSTDFRNQPETIIPELFDSVGLPFESAMLEWRACPQVELDNLGGRHRHLYGAVLLSSGIRKENEEVPELSSFPNEGGWRDHVAQCVEIYEEFAPAAERVQPAAVAS